MTDEEFLSNEVRYRAHMARFLTAHPAGGPMDVLRELERTERWAKMMGDAAILLEPPTLAELEKGV